MLDLREVVKKGISSHLYVAPVELIQLLAGTEYIIHGKSLRELM